MLAYRAFSSSAAGTALWIFVACLIVGSRPPLMLHVVTTVAVVAIAPRKAQASIAGVCVSSLFVPWPLPAFVGWAAWRLSQSQPPSFDGRSSHVAKVFVALAGLGSGLVAVAVTAGRWDGTQLLLPPQYLHPWIVIPAVVVTSVANAVSEELLWRKAWWSAMSDAPRVILVGTQVGSFGIAHLHGIPGGPLGCLLAGVFAAMAVWVRSRLGFQSAVWFHIAADLVIITGFALLATGPLGVIHA